MYLHAVVAVALLTVVWMTKPSSSARKPVTASSQLLVLSSSRPSDVSKSW